ncbi:hypothetical protein B0H13DRAFT_2145754, partial [Mycena leptocephala]
IHLLLQRDPRRRTSPVHQLLPTPPQRASPISRHRGTPSTPRHCEPHSPLPCLHRCPRTTSCATSSRQLGSSSTRITRGSLLDELHKKQMTELHSELRKNVFPGIKKAIGDAEKAEKERAKKAVQAAKAAAKRKAKKAVEREAARAAKAAGRARGRGRGRACAARGRAGVVGGGRDRGRARDSSEEEESNAESDSPDEETDLGDPVVGANSGPATTDTESSDEETDLDDPAVSVNTSPSTVNTPLAIQDESDNDNDSDQEETGIVSFNAHRWESRRNLEFQVVWTDGVMTWEPYSNVNDCLAMEEYLAHRDVADPLLLSKRKFLIKVGL